MTYPIGMMSERDPFLQEDVLRDIYSPAVIQAATRVVTSVSMKPNPTIALFESPMSHQRPMTFEGQRVALLPGSFNPPTLAHLALARAALASGCADVVLWTLSVVAVDKEQVARAALIDRIIMLDLCRRAMDIAAHNAAKGQVQDGLSRLDVGIGVVNRGLFVDIAAAVWDTWPAVAEVAFVVGYDKIAQIFDARYYADRTEALDRLFGRATFLVAPRADQDARSIARLLDLPANQPYANRVRVLLTPSDTAYLSSTQARTPASNMDDEGLSPRAHIVSPEIEMYMRETGAYDASSAQIDRYAIRLVILDLLQEEAALLHDIDMHALWKEATADTPRGAELRRILLSDPETRRHNLSRFHRPQL